MLDDPEDMLGACLKKLGLPFSATDPAELRRAEQEAIAQKPLLRAYLNAEVRDQLVAGDVLAAQLWSTTAQQAIDAAPQLAFAYPAEGFPFYCDCAVILRESRRASTGAPVPGLSAARRVAAGVAPTPDRHRQRRRPGAAAGGDPQQSALYPAARDLRPRRMAGHAPGRHPEAARPHLDRNQISMTRVGR